MKKSLVNKVKEGVKQIVKKAILPLAFVAGSYMATTQDANAQNKDNQKNIYSYENNNKGATIEKDKIRVEDGKDLEVKMLQGRGQYFQNLPLTIENFPKNTKKISTEDIANTFEDTLGLVSFYRNTAQYDLDAYTKGFLEVSSKEPYQWVKARDGEGNYLNVIPLSLKINPKTGKPEIYAEILCDAQLNKKNGITDKNSGYIAKENLEEILKQLTDNLSTINLNRVINEQKIKTNFYFPSASDSTVYLIPNIEKNTKLRILPATKNEKGVISRIRQVAIVSPLGVYEQVRTGGEVTIDNVPISTSGTADGAFAEPVEVEETKEEKTSKLVKQLGIEVGAGTNKEVTAGIFTNTLLTNGIRGEIFANYSVVKGESYIPKEPEIISESEQSLIGPGTYKTRLDKTTTSFSDKGIAEAGVGITFVPNKKIEFPLTAGIKFSQRTKTIDEKAAISYERNQENLGDPQIITNTLEENTFAYPLSLSGGVRYNISKNLSLEALYNRVENQNTGKIKLRVNF